MLTLTSNEQAEKLIKDGVLAVDDDVEIAFDGFSIEADIKCRNIYSKDYRRDINCKDIDCRNIDCMNINCEDIDCRNIDCMDINCKDINCWDINCGNIDCRDISYYAVCFAHKSLKCTFIKGRRDNCKHFCLNGEITFKEKDDDEVKVKVEVEGKTVMISRKSASMNKKPSERIKELYGHEYSEYNIKIVTELFAALINYLDEKWEKEQVANCPYENCCEIGDLQCHKQQD